MTTKTKPRSTTAVAPAPANPPLYQFTNNWFDCAPRAVWDNLIPQINPTKILEIGSYEGASACYLIESLASQKSIEIHCIDTWQGGIEHQEGGTAVADMNAVHTRFDHNIQVAVSKVGNPVALTKHQGYSDVMLVKLLAQGEANQFDFIYVDGSHQAPDVLSDAVLTFKLLKVGGVIAFDDYLWQENLPYGTDPVRCPKVAIDAFTNIYCRKLRVISAPLNQLYIQKISD